MARKIPVKLVMQFRAQGMSRKAISDAKKIGRDSVAEVFTRAEVQQIQYEDIKERSEDEIYRLFFPEKYQSEILYTLPDYKQVQKELTGDGVTLKLLWKEYSSACRANNEVAIGYSKFCEDYRKYIDKFRLTNHLVHKPAVTIEVDWSGSKMALYDPSTGEVIDVYLFVGTLPYSQYTYVEATLDMKSDTWLRCHVNMFEFFGGTSVRLVCDNLKTGVISHPKDGDIILNDQYQALSNHYVMAVMPAQVRKPKQKASVEGAVGKIATAIIASLRHQMFTSLPELQEAVRGKLDAYNQQPFQKREGSRQLVFETVEREKLRPLPSIPYEAAEWVYGRKINYDCHVTFEKNKYSCPYQYVKQSVDLKVTTTLVEIYAQHDRIATHLRFPAYAENQFSTHPEHLPEQFNQPEWTDKRILTWAESIGVMTLKVIQRVFESVQIKEQAYRPCLSILKLSHSYTDHQLEQACTIALEYLHSPRHRQLKTILSNPANENLLTSPQDKTSSGKQRGYLRGADYYSKETKND